MDIMDDFKFIERDGENYLLVKVRVIPNSKKNEIVDIGSRIKIKITEKPLSGKANKGLVEFLEDIFGCKAEIISGFKSRNKIIKVFCEKDKFIKKLKELGYV